MSLKISGSSGPYAAVRRAEMNRMRRQRRAEVLLAVALLAVAVSPLVVAAWELVLRGKR